ncbi:hypothetical protein QET93_010450 [Akkermansia sp. N21116]|uniref:hypothetical protein n=1 Tax=Akkermansia sp. N21116 TaxID=3040764 RepID=UPI002AC8C2FF|nr:hypothetical protein [Akkermansia sp. N21116]WPX39951.1 hypothetical protein QET93_010450 [Akkermansia sp. N21116]
MKLRLPSLLRAAVVACMHTATVFSSVATGTAVIGTCLISCFVSEQAQAADEIAYETITLTANPSETLTADKDTDWFLNYNASSLKTLPGISADGYNVKLRGNATNSSFKINAGVTSKSLSLEQGRFQITSYDIIKNAGTIILDGGHLWLNFDNTNITNDFILGQGTWSGDKESSYPGYYHSAFRTDSGATFVGNWEIMSKGTRIGVQANTIYMTGTVTGSGEILKEGAKDLFFGSDDGDNTKVFKDFTGYLKVQRGMVLLKTGIVNGAGMKNTVLAGGTLAIGYSGSDTLNTYDAGTIDVSSNSTLNFRGGAIINLNGLGTTEGVTDNGASITLNVTRNNADDLRKSQLNVSGTSTFSGTLNVQNNNEKAGELILSPTSANALASMTVNLAGKAVDKGKAILELSNDATIGGLKNSNAFVTVRSADNTARVLTFNNAENSTTEYTGSIGANISLVKQGKGTQTLSGDLSAINKAITIQSGRLSLGASTGLTQAVNIGAQGSLQLSGSLSLAASTDLSGQLLLMDNAEVSGLLGKTLGATALSGISSINLDLTDGSNTLNMGSLSLLEDSTLTFKLSGAKITDGQLTNFDLTASLVGDTSWVDKSILADIDGVLYGSSVSGNKILFAQINNLVDGSPSGDNLTYARPGGVTTLNPKGADTIYSMKNLIVTLDTDETTADSLMLNGVTLNVKETLSFNETTGTFTIEDGSNAGFLLVSSLNMGGGDLVLSTSGETEIGNVTGAGKLIFQKDATISGDVDGDLVLRSESGAVVTLDGGTKKFGNGIGMLNNATYQLTGGAKVFGKEYNDLGSTYLTSRIYLQQGSTLEMDKIGMAYGQIDFGRSDVENSGAVIINKTILLSPYSRSKTNIINIYKGIVFSALGTSTSSSNTGDGALFLGMYDNTEINIFGEFNLVNAFMGMNSSGKKTGTINIKEGGIGNFNKGVNVSGGGTVKVNVADGVALNIAGSNGIANIGNLTVTLSSGSTLGLIDDATVAKGLTLPDGTVTLHTDKYVLNTTDAAGGQRSTDGAAMTISGTLTGSADASLRIEGHGSVVLAGNNLSYLGGFTITKDATLTVNSLVGVVEGDESGAQVTQSINSASAITFEEGGRLVFAGSKNDNFAYAGNLRGAGSIGVDTTVKLSDLGVSGEVTVGKDGKLVLQKGIDLSGQTGAVTINGGTLNFTNQVSFGDNKLDINLNGGTINLAEKEGSDTSAKVLLRAGKLTVTDNSSISLNKVIGIVSADSLDGDAAGKTLSLRKDYNNDVDGIFELNGAGTFNGTVTLLNDCGGAAGREHFILRLNDTNALKNATVELQADTSESATNTYGTSKLELGVEEVTIAGLKSRGYHNNVARGSGVDKATLTIATASGVSNTYTSDIGDGVSIIHDGAGTQILTGDLGTFDSVMTARQGILDVSGATNLGATNAVTLNLDGGALKLGTLSGKQTLTTSAAGTGTLAGGLVLGGGVIVADYSLKNDSKALYQVDGALSLGTGDTVLTLDLASFAGFGAGTYTMKLLGAASLGFSSLDDSQIAVIGMQYDKTARSKLSFDTSGNTLTLNFKKSDPVSLSWAGTSGSHAWEVLKDASSWTNTQGLTGEEAAFHTGDSVVFGADAADKTVTVNGTVKPGSLSVTGGSYTFEKGTDGALSGNGALTVSGTGTVVSMKFASSDWSGAVSLQSGEVQFVSGGLGTGKISAGSGAKLTWLEGNEEDISARLKDGVAAGTSLALNISGAGDEVTFGTAVNNAASYAKEGAGTLTLDGTGILSGSLTINGGTVELKGNGDGGAGGVVKGAVSVVDGLLKMGKDATGWGGSSVNTSAIRVEEAGRVELAGSQTMKGLVLTLRGGSVGLASGVTGKGIDLFGGGAKILTEASGTTATISADVGLRQNDTVISVADGSADVDLLISGTVRNHLGGDEGNHALIKQGAGSLKITGNYEATGAVRVESGVLEFQSASLRAGDMAIAGSGTVRFNGTEAGGYVYGGSLSGYGGLTGTVEVAGGSRLSLTGANGDFGGTVVLGSGAGLTVGGAFAAGAVNTGDSASSLSFGGTGDKTISGSMTGTGALSVTGSTVLLSGDNSGYGGAVSISGGTLRAGSASALGTQEASISGGVLDINGNALANNVSMTGGSLKGGAGSGVGKLDIALSDATGTATLDGTLTAASLSLGGGNTLSSMTPGSTLSVTGGTVLKTNSRLKADCLELGTSLTMDNLSMSAGDALVSVAGALTSQGSVALNFSADFLQKLSEGNYTIASFGSDGGSLTEGIALGEGGVEMDWDDVSPIYSYALERSGDGASWVLRAYINTDTKTWIWAGNARADWVDGNTFNANWQGKEAETDGPANHAVFFGAAGDTSLTEHTVDIAAEGVTPVYVQVESNGTYIFRGGAIKDGLNAAGAPLATTMLVSGVGIVEFHQANEFTGGTTLRRGTLVMKDARALGTQGAITFDGGTLEFGTAMAKSVSDALSDRFSVNTTQDDQGNTILNDLNLAVGGEAGSVSLGLNSVLNSNAELVLNKFGTGDLELTGDFAGSIRLTDRDADTYSNIRRSDAGQGGTLTLSGESYNLVTVDAGHTLRINGAAVTLQKAVAGEGGVSILGGRSLAMLEEDATVSASVAYGQGSSMSVGNGTVLSGDTSLSGTSATLSGNGGPITLAGAVRSSGTAGSACEFVLDQAVFNLSGAAIDGDAVTIVLGNGVPGAGTRDTSLVLGDGEDALLALDKLRLNADAAITGSEGQRLVLQDAVLSGALEGDYTLVAAGGVDHVVLLNAGVDTGSVLMEVDGGILDLNDLALDNDITIKGGALRRAGGWSASGTVTALGGAIDASGFIGGPAVSLDMGGLTGSALRNATLASGSSIDNLGRGNVLFNRADLVLDSMNATIKDASTGQEIPQGPGGAATALINFAAPQGSETTVGMAGDGVMNIQLGEDLQTNILRALTVKYDASELLPDYAEPQPLGDRVSLSITNGTLDPGTAIRFNPLFREWGLQIVGIQGGNVIVDGNLSVWLASRHGDITGNGDLIDYRAVYVDRDMNVTLPASGSDGDNPALVMKYVSGVRGANLNISCGDASGTARAILFNGRDKDGDLVHSRLAGNLTGGERTLIEKTGEATLAIGGTLSSAGTVAVREGRLELTASGRSHSVAALEVTGAGTGTEALLTLSGLDSVLEAGSLSVGANGRIALDGDGSLLSADTLDGTTGGAIDLGEGTRLNLVRGGTWKGTIRAATPGEALVTLRGGELLLSSPDTSGETGEAARSGLDGVTLDQAEGATLALESGAEARLRDWYTSDSSGTPGAVAGSLSGAGTAAITGTATFGGSLASFTGSLKAAGDGAHLTVTTLDGAGAALAADSSGTLTLDYRAGSAAYGSLSASGGGTVHLLAGNSEGANNTLTLNNGGSIAGDSVLAFTLNTSQGINSEGRPLLHVASAEGEDAVQATLGIGSGATLRLAAARGQEYIDGDLPLQVALADHVVQEGDVRLAFDELFGKYFDTAASSVRTVNGILTLTTAANRNGFYIHRGQSEVATAGGSLLDRVLTTLNPQAQDPAGELAGLLNAVDARISAGDATGASRLMAASAGSTVTSLLTAQRWEFQNQQNMLRNRVANMGLNPAYTYAGDLPLYNMWAQGTGSYNRVDGDGDCAGYQLNTWGGTFGADIDLSPSLTVGAAFSASYGDLTSSAADTLSGTLDGYYVSLFGRYQHKNWGHSLILTGSWNNATYDRSVNGGAGTGGYEGHGETSGSAYGALYELSYDISLGDETSGMILQPIVTAQVARYTMNDYSETGAGAAGLGVGGLEGTTATVAAGARFLSLIGSNVFGRQSQGELRLQVAQDMGDTRTRADVGFTGLPQYRTGVRGAELGTTSLQFGAGLSIPSGEQGTIFAEANGDIRSGATSINGSLGYRYNF